MVSISRSATRSTLSRGVPRRSSARSRADNSARDVVVGTGVEAGDPFVERILRGEHDDRKRRLARSDVAQHLEARPSWQHEVEDDGVVIHDPGLFAGRIAVVQHIHGIALLFEAGLDETGHLSVVLNDQDAHGVLRFLLTPYRDHTGHNKGWNASLTRINQRFMIVSGQSSGMTDSGEAWPRQRVRQGAGR
jgi:hypothetical protein